ncbi:Serine/threonine-protein phosphatase 7 long form homolog, partial [Linum perenne]
GRTVRVAWVKRLFDRLPDGSTGEVITYHARAYTWVLLAGVLLADRNGDHIPVHLLQLIGDPRVASTYSWGSAVLAWLYKWMSYADRTEEFALDGDILWRSVTPLLCIDCIAWHHPDRCIRQFGFDQRVPQDPEPAGHVEGLLAADFRSSVTDWVAKYQQFVLHWEQRGSHIATGELVSDDSRHHFHDEYDEWYRRRTPLSRSGPPRTPLRLSRHGQHLRPGHPSSGADRSTQRTICSGTGVEIPPLRHRLDHTASVIVLRYAPPSATQMRSRDDARGGVGIDFY